MTTDQPEELGQDQFFKWMGKCVAEWAELDDELFDIFTLCVGQRKQCAIIYFKQPGLEIRLSLLDEIVASVFPDLQPGEHPHALLKEWKELSRQIRDFLPIRRRIAHQQVVAHTEVYAVRADGSYAVVRNVFADFNKPGSEAVAVETYSIQALESERLRAKERNAQKLDLNDLINHYQSVNGLLRPLYQFYLDLAAWLTTDRSAGPGEATGAP